MGIYDRDYERNRGYGGSPGYHLGGQLTWTTKLVIVMFAVYAVQLLTRPTQPARPGGVGWFTETFSLHADLLRRPWLAFELVTYGFLHSVTDIKHILFNTLALWMFGRSVEYRYGAREYLTFFFAAVAFAGLFWVLGEMVANGGMADISMLGASGGITAVLLLFCLNFPHQQVFIWGVLPLPAWMFAILFIGLDVAGAVARQGSVAYTAHLGGALLALVYFRGRWRMSNWLPTQWKMPRLRRRPPLRVLDPQADEDESSDNEVDDILRKIREHGQDSLTRRERRILEQASREYQKRRS
jgi:rhomboid family protein